MKLASALLLSLVIFGASVPPRVTRVTMAAMETSIDRKMEGISIDDPFLLLGATRCVYLEGYGAVFSSELDLLASAAPNPFRPEYNKDEIARLKNKKQNRIVVLEKNMRDMLISSAASLDAVPVNERIVLAITIPYYKFEDSSGMPRQIVMQAPKKALVEASRGNGAALESVLQVQKF